MHDNEDMTQREVLIQAKFDTYRLWSHDSLDKSDPLYKTADFIQLMQDVHLYYNNTMLIDEPLRYMHRYQL